MTQLGWAGRAHAFILLLVPGPRPLGYTRVLGINDIARPRRVA
jgi:hypothetical protein